MDVIGVVTHHDSITGTSRQRVSEDYVQKIKNGIKMSNPVYGTAIANIARKAGISIFDWS